MNITPPPPFEEGHWAREEDMARSANPYPRGCHHFNEWDRGWENADTAIRQERHPNDPPLPERRPKKDE